MQSKKLFTGGINTDDSPAFLKANEYIGALNVRFTGSDDGKTGIVTNIDGNSKRAFNPDGSIFTLPAGTNRTIGAYEDKTKKRIYFFNYNSSLSHGIYCYDQPLDCVYTVLLSANVTDGLGFSNDIHSVAMIGDLLYWTDNLNPQRRINVEAGIKRYYPSYTGTTDAYPTTIDFASITLIRPQPMLPLDIAKGYNSSYAANYIKKEPMQFAYRFIYRDYEASAISTLSVLSSYNLDSQNYNYIGISVPFTQLIPDDVLRIEFMAKYMVGGKYYIIKIYDKTVTADASAITAHNAATTRLSFNFYNDIAGIVIDDATSAKQYDFVPVKSETLEVGKDRLFLGNNTEGYQSPTSTSLALTQTVSSTVSSPTTEWVRISYYNTVPSIGTYHVYLINILGAGSNSGYYTPYPVVTASPGAGPYDYNNFVPTSATGQYIGPNLGSVATWIPTQFGTSAYMTGTLFTGSSPIVTNIPASSGITGLNVFKTDSWYRFGVVFYDFAGRKCGVVTSDSLTQKIPQRSSTTSSYTTSINWTLTSSASDIPSWAYYYSVVMTKCQTATSFIQSKTEDIAYILKDPTTGVYSISYAAYSTAAYGVAISTRNISANKMGYTYQEGDMVNLYIASNSYKLKIKDDFGEYIIVDLADIGTPTAYGTVNGIVEIYTPYIPSFEQYYYEVGQTYKINNPTLSTRAYSTISGSIVGDVYINSRSSGGVTYVAEAMSPNDTYWSSWYTNAGRINLTSKERQVTSRTTIRWSGFVTLGTEVNGASTFDYFDFKDLPVELSSIKRLMLVNKIESEGTVMLAIGEHETASLYLGESQVFDNTGASFLAKTTGVVGNVNVLRGSYGTINPESVAEYLGQVFWFDANKGSVIRYDVNGLIPISDYKMSVYWNKVSVDVRAGNKIFAGFDPYYNEFLLYAPRVSNSPSSTKLEDVEIGSTLTASYAGSGAVTLTVTKGKLYKLSITAGHTLSYGGQVVAGGSSNNTVMVEATTGFTVTAGGSGSISYTEILVNQYEPYDSLGGVWCFKPEINRWTSKYSYRPEWMGRVANTLVSFKDGFCYTHNHYISNTFYGQAYDSYLSFVHSDAGSTVKVYNSIAVEGDTPYMVHTRTTNPYEQSTNLMSDEFRIIEGVNYGSLMRDRLSPNVAGTYDLKMLIGDRVRGEYAKFTILHRNPTSDKEIKFATISFNPSRGQKV
jgi:hypothetical protein